MVFIVASWLSSHYSNTIAPESRISLPLDRKLFACIKASSSMYVLSFNHWVRYRLTSASSFRAYIYIFQGDFFQSSFYFGVWNVGFIRWWCSRRLPLLLHWCCSRRMQLWRHPNTAIQKNQLIVPWRGNPRLALYEIPRWKKHEVHNNFS